MNTETIFQFALVVIVNLLTLWFILHFHLLALVGGISGLCRKNNDSARALFFSGMISLATISAIFSAFSIIFTISILEESFSPARIPGTAIGLWMLGLITFFVLSAYACAYYGERRKPKLRLGLYGEIFLGLTEKS